MAAQSSRSTRLSDTLGSYIRRCRQQAGLSLRKLAELAHVDPAYLSRVEHGAVPPSDALVRAVADATGTKAEELFLLAGRIPEEWRRAIAASPTRAVYTIHTALASWAAEPSGSYSPMVLAFDGTRAIEDHNFPFEELSEIAELESWRKEINRPIYHTHKWWAQRLGSVFRAILLGAFAPKGSDVLEMFYQPARLIGAVVFDPFMGSGTTIGEALKLGAKAIGRDINPVSHLVVRTALGIHSRREVVETFLAIQRDVAPAIQRFYRTRLPDGRDADALYYFWVKVLPCPRCSQPVDLFSSYVFAQHAYPARNPEARAVCPHCGAINKIRYDAHQARCTKCHDIFRPSSGPANGTKASCPRCSHEFLIAKTVRALARPPHHRLYAKLVLMPSGSKEYMAPNESDFELYEKASQALKGRKDAYPIAEIQPGYNTNQVLNYSYARWHQMFNDRQLLCLSILAGRIRKIQNAEIRDLFVCLFSGVLEFNNMFASYKGEGTGAVRHMFSHHILKPERTPLEANIWGTPKSSGAFSTLFERRLLRAFDYREHPFELRVIHRNGRFTGEKVYGLSYPVGHEVSATFTQFKKGGNLYLSCGDSAKTDLAPASVDVVITDPPFFDNVHYSQLADFFYVWQRYILSADRRNGAATTRSSAEVQQSDPSVFSDRLQGVWAECHRVLRPSGLLIFTYHHSRAEGWRCILEALVRSGFGITAAQPIKAEMSVATPKRQAKEPIDLDVILVCRKRETVARTLPDLATVADSATQEAGHQVERFNNSGRALSRNDVRVVLMAQIVKRLSWHSLLTESINYLDSVNGKIEQTIERLHQRQEVKKRTPRAEATQLALW